MSYKNTLDHIMLKTAQKLQVFVVNSAMTDHSFIALSMIPKKNIKLNTPKFICKIDFIGAIAQLATIAFSFIALSNDADYTSTLFVNKIIVVIKQNTNVCVVPCRKRTLKPWVTPSLLRCIRHRDKIHKKKKKMVHIIIC